ncbi:MAG: nuclear transport factor 2 family protein [Peptostreptococcaceae bacterium]|nr:nuclear transport factor 2 family protein [Peptostreptococcaceae bacterium]
MSNKEVLTAFFKAENERDRELYQQFLHPEISWQLYDKEEKRIIGIEKYMQVIKNVYADTDARFSCIDMQISADGDRIVTLPVNTFGVRSLDIFDFKDGAIYRE